MQGGHREQCTEKILTRRCPTDHDRKCDATTKDQSRHECRTLTGQTPHERHEDGKRPAHHGSIQDVSRQRGHVQQMRKDPEVHFSRERAVEDDGVIWQKILESERVHSTKEVEVIPQEWKAIDVQGKDQDTTECSRPVKEHWRPKPAKPGTRSDLRGPLSER